SVGQRRFQGRVDGHQLIHSDQREYAHHCRSDQPEPGAGRCGLVVGVDDDLYPGRIAERRPAHVDDQYRRVVSGPGEKGLADRAGVDGIDLGGQRDHRLLTHPAKLDALGGHGCWPADGWRRKTSRAMSSAAGPRSTMAPITVAQTDSGGSAVTAWHSRVRASSISSPRRSIRPSVKKHSTVPGLIPMVVTRRCAPGTTPISRPDGMPASFAGCPGVTMTGGQCPAEQMRTRSRSWSNTA